MSGDRLFYCKAKLYKWLIALTFIFHTCAISLPAVSQSFCTQKALTELVFSRRVRSAHLISAYNKKVKQQVVKIVYGANQKYLVFANNLVCKVRFIHQRKQFRLVKITIQQQAITIKAIPQSPAKDVLITSIT
ncbi:hypothetical protein JN11_01107 [Mucilaginibacter frigoritolerans]|uniref:Uncharacterized protein n=1 Tax=Mucilaginibacter frigoritolerans TaxID=652788 RepID=A0A562UE43_9SPHI|nr:hypothetical protein JN11_01107 [Mucilaginibacter frigoritolerans]